MISNDSTLCLTLYVILTIMASVWKHPKSRFWYACYTDHTGKQRKRSTKLTDRNDALGLAVKWERSYRRVQSEIQARRVLADIYRDITRRELQFHTVRTFFESWLERKEQENARSTYVRYKGIANAFLEHLGELADQDLSSVTTDEVAEYRDHISRSLSPSSANQQMKVLRVAFKEAWKRNLIEENPAAKVDTIKNGRAGSAGERRPFTVREVRLILEHANQEWTGMILCGYYTGQRLGDIARLTWNNLDLVRKEIRFVTQKTGRPTGLPIAEPLLKHLETLPAGDEPGAPLFPAAYEMVCRQRRVNSLSSQFHAILVSAGFAAERSKVETGTGHSVRRVTGALSFHCLRHTLTSSLKNAGASEAVTMDIVGHESKAVSRQYTHIEDGVKRAALDSLPDITVADPGLHEADVRIEKSR